MNTRYIDKQHNSTLFSCNGEDKSQSLQMMWDNASVAYAWVTGNHQPKGKGV